MIDLLNLTEDGLNANTAVELRKAGAELGIKGASKGKKADLIAAILQLKADAEAEIARVEKERALRTALRDTKPQAPVVKRDRTGRTTNCTECGRKLKGDEFGGLCAADREYGEWENNHSDENHGEGREIEGCPICFPDLDPRKPVAKGRSRAGMVIVAKGTEIHKSATFRTEAEKLGWTVTVQEQTYDDGDALNTRYYADAHKGDDAIQLAWDGRAYDYAGSSAKLGGKDRKVRNLKEALRFLAL